MAFVGRKPHRKADHKIVGRRPVVAILDSGCGSHEWLDDIVRTDVRLDDQPIGHTDPNNHPEFGGDHDGRLDGMLDPFSGHGTFIAGLVHQSCPDADIVAWRIIASDGLIVEADWLRALTQITELVRRDADGEPGGLAIDVLNMSIGYYHETPEDALFDPVLRKVLNTLARCGTTVVCSAGNHATARPFHPAAFAPHQGGREDKTDRAALISVGALNPDGTVALFSNAGPWVRAYAPGASLVSTMPRFEGGLQPWARATAFGQVRESIDPDDFGGGFGVWSGTSFSAPLVSGRIAATLVGQLSPHQALADRIEHARTACAKVLKKSQPASTK